MARDAYASRFKFVDKSLRPPARLTIVDPDPLRKRSSAGEPSVPPGPGRRVEPVVEDGPVAPPLEASRPPRCDLPPVLFDDVCLRRRRVPQGHGPSPPGPVLGSPVSGGHGGICRLRPNSKSPATFLLGKCRNPLGVRDTFQVPHYSLAQSSTQSEAPRQRVGSLCPQGVRASEKP